MSALHTLAEIVDYLQAQQAGATAASDVIEATATSASGAHAIDSTDIDAADRR